MPGELSLAAGLVLVAFSVALMVRADLGISTISSLPYTLSMISGNLSFGTWNIIFQVCLLIVLLAITRRFKWGYLAAFLIATVFGYMVDMFNGMMSGTPTGLEIRLLYFVASYPMMCLAIALMVSSKVPLMIVDSFINDLSAFYHVTFRRMKTLCDLTFMGLSAALSLLFLNDLAGVGVGTVIMALTTGAGVHAMNQLLDRTLVIRPWSRTLGTMAS